MRTSFMANRKVDALMLIMFIPILVCLLRTFSLFFSTMEVCLPLGIQTHFVKGEESYQRPNNYSILSPGFCFLWGGRPLPFPHEY